MKPLDEVAGFPEELRRRLLRELGIDTAEAFYARGVANRAGMSAALRMGADELDWLIQLAEAHLSPQFLAQCQQPPAKHARGVILD